MNVDEDIVDRCLIGYNRIERKGCKGKVLSDGVVGEEGVGGERG